MIPASIFTLLAFVFTNVFAVDDNVTVAFITSFFTFLGTVATVYFAYKANQRAKDIAIKAEKNQALLMKRRAISTSSEEGVYVEPPKEVDDA